MSKRQRKEQESAYPETKGGLKGALGTSRKGRGGKVLKGPNPREYRKKGGAS